MSILISQQKPKSETVQAPATLEAWENFLENGKHITLFPQHEVESLRPGYYNVLKHRVREGSEDAIAKSYLASIICNDLLSRMIRVCCARVLLDKFSEVLEKAEKTNHAVLRKVYAEIESSNAVLTDDSPIAEVRQAIKHLAEDYKPVNNAVKEEGKAWLAAKIIRRLND